MKKINLNKIAIEISKLEGKKKAVNIGQIKEVMRCFLSVLQRDYNNEQIAELMNRWK